MNSRTENHLFLSEGIVYMYVIVTGQYGPPDPPKLNSEVSAEGNNGGVKVH